MSVSVTSRSENAVCTPGSSLYGEIVEFYYREADLFDSSRLVEWLEMLAPDIQYVMPVRTTKFRAKGEGFEDVSFFDENFVSLQTRVQRLQTEFAWAEAPPSRTRHFVTNILAAPGELSGEFSIRSNFMITRTRADQGYQLFTGQRQDLLRREGEHGFKLAARRILIDQTVLSGSNLSIFF
jgi:3-phenylpropionate/cinnamic acid dioxygenase small subunit